MDDISKFVPGSIEIRPTRAQAEREPEKFYPLLEALRGPDTLPLRKIAEIAGDTSLNPEPNTLRKIRSQTLSDETRRSLLRHIFDDEQLVSRRMRRKLAGIDDALYFAFLEHFQICDTAQDQARAQVAGTYKFWRPHADLESEYVLGKLSCFEDPISRALRIDIHTRKTGDGAGRRIDLHFSGYLFCLHGMFLTVARRLGSEEVRVGLFPRFRINTVGTDVNSRSVFAGRQNHVVLMDGMTFSIDRRTCFFAPVHLSLVDDVDELAKLDEALDIVTEGDPRLPQRVINRLGRRGPPKWL